LIIVTLIPSVQGGSGKVYGIVTNAIGDLIVSNYGVAKWEAVQETAGVEADFLISTEPYPDELSYRLIYAACDVLDCRIEDFLIQFGKHWVLETGVKYYGPLLVSGYTGLKDFLLNLPDFHTRILLLYPQLKPPEFACTDVTDNSMRLHYFTTRPGLTNFMVGLLRGLGELHNVSVDIALVAAKDDGADHDIFEIRWEEPVK
jgi:hypothetical protein